MSDSQKPPIDLRKHFRRRAWKGAKVLLHDNATVADCVVRDISANGARLVFKSFYPLPKRFRLRINDIGTFECEIMRISGLDYGVRFLAAAAPAANATNPLVAIFASTKK